MRDVVAPASVRCLKEMGATMKKKHRSRALRSLGEAAKDLQRVGAIDKATLRDFEIADLTSMKPSKPEKNRRAIVR